MKPARLRFVTFHAISIALVLVSWPSDNGARAQTQSGTGSSVDRPLPLPSDEAKLRQAGIRSLAGAHLTLYTDLPPVGAVDELPRVFDQAVGQWCRYFQIPPERVARWRLTGYLMDDRERFRQAGLLPDDLPKFLPGLHKGHQLWLDNQPSDYYRRHLLLHEGTHGFMHWALGGVGPPWYAEGVAELLATHRWCDGQLKLGHFPATKEEVPHWGRIKIVQDELAARRGMTLGQVMSYDAEAYVRVEPYGWCWAAAALLDGHPSYQTRFRALASHVRMSGTELTSRCQHELGGDQRELDEQWQLFLTNMEYGYDFAREAVSYAPGLELPTQGAELAIAADRGWQSTGFRLRAGVPYHITASGRYQIAVQREIWWCEPGGVTIRYYRGRPLGMLVGQVRPDLPGPGLSPLTEPEPIGLSHTMKPDHDGTLYLRINDSPAEWSDNRGELRVSIVPR